MAGQSAGPWFRTAKNSWYAKVGDRQFALGVRGKENRKAATDAWHQLMANGPAVRPTTTDSTVAELVELFLADAESRLKQSTVKLYRADLRLLADALGRVPAERLTAADLVRWFTRQEVSDTTKAIRLRSVGSCFGWAVKTGVLEQNPTKRVPRPRGRSRSESAVITPDAHARLLAAASPEFRLVLRVLHATGCRPGELRGITAETFYPDAGVVKLTEHKTDRTGKPRLIYLPPDIVEALKAQTARYPVGSLLRSRRGMPWTTHSICEAFERLREKTGVTATAYGYRHTLATDGLAGGIPETHVAELLGHSSTAMLHKHYSHLTAKAGILRNAAALVRPGTSTSEPHQM